MSNHPKTRSEALKLGVIHYFTGSVCKNGHTDIRFAKDGACKSCSREKRSKQYKQNPEKNQAISNAWKQKNKNKVKQYMNNWREKNASHVADYAEKYRNQNKIKRNHAKEEWRLKNIDKVRKYARERYANNLIHKLNHKIRSMVNRVNKGHFSKAITYTEQDLKQRLEFQFKPGMSWENYGKWEIDHKIPVSHMIARGIKDPMVINALSNLQPLWKNENRTKNNRWVG